MSVELFEILVTLSYEKHDIPSNRNNNNNYFGQGNVGFYELLKA